jgi:hypothetical protein
MLLARLLRRVRRDDACAGSATVEFAVALPAVIAVAILCVSLIAAALTRVSLQETARQGARLAMVGMTATEVLAALGERPGTLQIATDYPHVTVTATSRARLLGLQLPGITLTETATGYLEEAIGVPQ